MTRNDFIRCFGIDPLTLTWKTGHNGLFRYASEDFGPYAVYHDSAWGYYVARNNSVVNVRINLTDHLRREA